MNHSVQEKELRLKNIIIDMFQGFYYRQKKNGIYAFALEIDELLTIQNFLLSTEASIFNETENKEQYLLEDDKWNLSKWKLKIKNSDENKKLITEKTADTDQDGPLSRILEDTYSQYKENNELNILLESFSQAILYLSKIYKLDTNKIVFFIYSASIPNLAIESAQKLNRSSSFLFEFIANLTISQQQSHYPIKLNQVDKDLLIDLAQTIEMTEPFDALFVAHQAYLLSFEPEFKEVNIHVQNLLQHLSTLDNQDFALTKQEILDRIHQFYKV